MSKRATLKGCLIQIRQTCDDDDVRSFEEGAVTYPLFLMLKSACDQDPRLAQRLEFMEHIIYSSRLTSVINGVFPFHDHLAFLYARPPDFLAVSCYTWSMPLILRFLAYCKAVLPTMRTILGGPHFNCRAEGRKAMQHSSDIDFVVHGLGQRPFVSLLRWMLDGDPALEEIGQLAYRVGDKIVETEGVYPLGTLDEFPSYVNERYRLSLTPRTLFFHYMTVGCINSCAYCSWDAMLPGRRPVTLSVKRGLQELAVVFRDYPDSEVCYGDAFFLGGSRERAKQFLEGVIALRQMHRASAVVLMGNLNYMTTDQSLLDLCKAAWFLPLPLGLQAYDERVWLDINRPAHHFARLLDFARLLKRNGFPVLIDLIFGLPTQTAQMFIEGLCRLIVDVAPDGFNVAQLQVIPGTKYYERKDSPNYRIVERDSVLLSTRSISFDELRYLNLLVWGLRIGYEAHRYAFDVARVVLEQDLESAMRDIAQFVCNTRGYEPCQCYENFEPSYLGVLHRYFLEYLSAVAASNQRLASVLDAVVEIARYDLARVEGKFRRRALFESFSGCGERGGVAGKTIRLKEVTLFSSKFDVGALLSNIEGVTRADDAAMILGSISPAEGGAGFFLFHGAGEIRLSCWEFRVASFMAGRWVHVGDEVVRDVETGECVESPLSFLDRLLGKNLLDIQVRRGEPPGTGPALC